jgi:hypothetical protein
MIGAFLVGTYDTFIRRDPKTDDLRGPWQRENHDANGDITATS